MKKCLTRRHLLRGAGAGVSVAVALPWLEAMMPNRAAAQAVAAPKRMGIFFFGNGRGVRANRWNPTSTGPNWQLSPQLAPLSDYKEYLNVVTGMDAKTTSNRGHHRGTAAMLSGGNFESQPRGTSNFRSTFKFPSIDQIAAAELGKQSRFPSMEVGIAGSLSRKEGTTLFAIAHKGPDNVSEGERDPSKVFERLFGEGAAEGQTDETTARLRMLRRSVLDTVAEDTQSLLLNVGARDRVRLEQHLQNVREIEKRVAALSTEGGAACATPPAPGKVSNVEARMSVMSQLLASALACDATRVFSVLFVGSVAGPKFGPLTKGHHGRSHDGAGGQDQMDAATRFIMAQFGVLLQALKDTPDVEGTNLLDNSGILCTSDVSNGQSHSIKDMPVMLAGGAGGALRNPGRHVATKGANTSQVLLTLLRAVGLPLNEFGHGGGRVTSGVSEIEA